MNEYKVISFTLQGLYICVISTTEISGLQAHIKLAVSQIKYVSEVMPKEAAELHCAEMLKEYEDGSR